MGSFRRLLNNKKSINEPFASRSGYSNLILFSILREKFPIIYYALLILSLIIMVTLAYIYIYHTNKHIDTVTVQAELYNPSQYPYNQPYSQYPYNQPYLQQYNQQY